MTIVRTIVAGNLLWVAASAVAAVTGAWELTGWGVAVVLAQAAAVAVLAALQAAGLRRP